jgi:exosortase A
MTATPFGSLWQRHLTALALTIIAVLLLFARDTAAMADQWWNSSTYGHCLFILPLTTWLIWQRRGEVAAVEPRAWTPGLLAIAVAALTWLIGEAAGVSLVRHTALIAMIQAAILTVIGQAAFRALLFPIFYLIFLIPFGDELVPGMQTLTARMTMGLLHLADLKAVLDGVFITTEAGWFEVAEACAGVKFLVAMAAYATLVAHVCFKSWTRRLTFMAFAIAAPILANGLRAFGTIYAAHLTSIETATGLDHIVYGWVFFALVILFVVAVAWPFFDRNIGENWLEMLPVAKGVQRAPHLIAVAAIALTTVPLIWSATVIAAGRQKLPNSVAMPDVAGWTRISIGKDGWQPRFDGADHQLFGRYRDARGRVVDVGIALYGWQGEGRQIVGFGQGAIVPDTNWGWSANVPAPSGGKSVRMIGPSKSVREAVTFYVVGGRSTGNVLIVKLRTLREKLLGGDQAAVSIVLSAPEPGARATLSDFLAVFGPIDKTAGAFITAARGE